MFDLGVGMKTLELKYGCQISVTQVSGLRMIDQGTAEVSRGQWNEGVTAGLNCYIFAHGRKLRLRLRLV